MDGIHDLGGRDGFGDIDFDPDEPVFHARWEGRVFGTAIAAMMAGGFNTPMFRHAIERMDPAHYLTSSYYEHWLTAVATLATENGLIDSDELVRRTGDFPLSRPVSPRAGDVGLEAPSDAARFSPGDKVRVRERHPFGHTRCPWYVRGKRGVVERFEGNFAVPEIEAHAREQVPEATYGVRFDAHEVWGEAAEPNSSIHVDLYERYLEQA